jgi:hypothetical protein
MTERFLQAGIARWTNIPGDIYTCLLCNVLYKYIIQRIYGYTYIGLIIHVSEAMQVVIFSCIYTINVTINICVFIDIYEFEVTYKYKHMCMLVNLCQ